MKTKTLLAAALTATLGYGTIANASIIDLFDGTQSVTDSSANSSPEFDQFGPSATIIGSYRDLVVNLLGNDFGLSNPATLEVINGNLSFSLKSGVEAVGIVQWDGDDNSADLDPLGLNEANLIIQPGCPVQGCDRFVATVLFADIGFEYAIGVYTNADDYAILTSASLGTTGEQAVYLFEWFTRSTGDYEELGLPFHIDSFGNGPNLQNVGALDLKITGAAAIDLTIDSITKTVPEPGMLALMGIGMLAGGLAGRRRQAHKA